MKKLLLSFLFVGTVFVSCDKGMDVMEVTPAAVAELGDVVVDGLVGEDPFDFEDGGTSVSGKTGAVVLNEWSRYKTRSNANFDFEYYAVDGASYIRPNGNTRKKVVLVLATDKGTSNIVKYSLRIYDKKKVNIVGTDADVIASEVEAAVLAYSYPFNANQVVLLDGAGFSKGDIDAAGNVHYTKTANEITIGIAKVAVGDINLYSEGVDESHQNLRIALYIANSHFGPIGGDSTGNSLVRRSTFAVGEIAILRNAGFVGDENLGTLRWTNGDVHIDFHYYNGTEWVTVSTPGRTGASSRGYSRDEPGNVAVAVAYAVSLFSNEQVFAANTQIFLNEGGWTRNTDAQGSDTSYTQYVDGTGTNYLQFRVGKVTVDTGANSKRVTLYNIAALRSYLTDFYAGALHVVLPSDEMKWLAEAGFVLVGQSDSRYRFQKNRTSPSQQCGVCFDGVSDDYRTYIDVHKDYSGYLVAGTGVVTARYFAYNNMRGAIERANSFLTVTQSQENQLAALGFVRTANNPSNMAWRKAPYTLIIALGETDHPADQVIYLHEDGSSTRGITVQEAIALATP